MWPTNSVYYEISLQGNRFLRPGEFYNCRLTINKILINNVPVTYLQDLKFFLGRSLYNISINSEERADVPISLRVPGAVGSWYPSMLISGIDYYKFIQQIPFSFS